MAEGDKIFNVESTETIKRTYRVLAADEKSARTRLHLHWKDPEMLREGVVEGPGSESVGSRQVTKVTATQSRADGPQPKAAAD